MTKMTKQTETRSYRVDWSDSDTSPTEVWKNPFFTAEENLQAADGSIHFHRQIIKNLRRKIKELENRATIDA